MADDYFAAIQRVELRLDPSTRFRQAQPTSSGQALPTAPQEEPPPTETAQEPEQAQLLALVEQLAKPELCFPARLEIMAQLRQALGWVETLPQAECFMAQISEHPPPVISRQQTYFGSLNFSVP